VDRLTTGRRHPRAGSVTVTELISRQATPALCTDSSPAAPDDELDDYAGMETDDVTDTIPVVLQAAHRREPTRSAQLAKLATLGVAGVVLCGAVTISSVIAHQRRESAQPATRPTVQITGEQALLPDKLDKTVPETPAPVSSATPAAVPARQTPAPTAAPGTPDTGTTASGSDVAAGPVDDEQLVREFYANLPDAPAVAFDLLSPAALDMSLADFLSSWATVTEIDDVDVVQQGKDVLATVRMRLRDGGHLRVQQLLTVADSPRRIVGAQLLSAQRN
jgi:hypothetical protein